MLWDWLSPAHVAVDFMSTRWRHVSVNLFLSGSDSNMNSAKPRAVRNIPLRTQQVRSVTCLLGKVQHLFPIKVKWKIYELLTKQQGGRSKRICVITLRRVCFKQEYTEPFTWQTPAQKIKTNKTQKHPVYSISGWCRAVSAGTEV